MAAAPPAPVPSAASRRLRPAPPSPRTLLLIAVPVAVILVLLALVAADPAVGVTASNGPFTDESWDVMNARNLVLLGRWATDDWTLHLVNLPFSVAAAAAFWVLGVGIVQARLVSIVATGVTAAALGLGLRRHLGAGPAALASVAFSGATLVLFYGRLAFLEPSVAMWLTLGALTVLRAGTARAGRWGIVAGVLLALAVGTKPSAIAAVGGMLAAVAVVGARRPAVRRWVGGAVLSIATLGLGWVAAIWLPNRQAIADVLRIWAPEPILAPIGTMLHRVLAFPTSNDKFLAQSAPLVACGTAGWALAAIGWRRLSPEVRLLLALATGWLVAGLGLLAIAPYRPNRYELPMLPALAILVGVGARVAAGWSGWREARWRVVAGAALATVLVVPGAASQAGWAANATYRLPVIQAQLLAAVPAGSVSQGTYAPAFLMRTGAITIVSRPAADISPGDLYATRGVRWFVGEDGEAPVWASAHAAAWAARQAVLCSPWGTTHVCVYRLP